MRLRDELVKTARRMSELGLTPGMSGNVSVRSPVGMLVTPSGMPYSEITGDDLCEMKMDGTLRPGQKTPTSEWQLHRDILGARQNIQAIVHTHSLYCTTISALRRPIPAIHYMIALASSDEIPCAEYATFGSAELALNAVSALRSGDACLLANHGMIALGTSLASALRLAAEIETLAAQYWHACSIGQPHILGADELKKVKGRFASYGQGGSKTRRSW